MAKFCGKCGSRLDPDTGLCPKCESEKRTLKEQKSLLKAEAKEAEKAERKASEKAEKQARKEAGKKAKREKKEAKRQRRKARPIGFRILRILLLLILMIVLALFGFVLVTGNDLYYPIRVYEEQQTAEIMHEQHEKLVTSEVTGEQKDENGKTQVILKVTHPDYTALFKEADHKHFPREYLLKQMKAGKVPMKTGEVSYVKEKDETQNEKAQKEAIDSYLTGELLDATGAVKKGGEGQ